MKSINDSFFGSPHQHIFHSVENAAVQGGDSLKELLSQNVKTMLPVTSTVLDAASKMGAVGQVATGIALLNFWPQFLAADALVNIGRLGVKGVSAIPFTKVWDNTREGVKNVFGTGQTILERGVNFTNWYVGHGLIYPIAATARNAIAATLNQVGQTFIHAPTKIIGGMAQTVGGVATSFTKKGRSRVKKGLRNIGQGVVLPFQSAGENTAFMWQTLKDQGARAAAGRIVAFTSAAGWEAGTNATLAGAREFANGAGPFSFISWTREKFNKWKEGARPAFLKSDAHGVSGDHGADHHGGDDHHGGGDDHHDH